MLYDAIKPDSVPGKILQVLSDGRRHPATELLELIRPSGKPNLIVHISKIRKVLNRRGEDIVCVRRGYQSCYQHVRLLTDPYSGRI